MIQIIAFRIFFEQAQAPSVRIRNWVDLVVRLGEINLVIISNDLSLRLSFQTHLDNVSALVIEEAVAVTQPGNGTEENNWVLEWVGYRNILTSPLILGLFAGRVRVVSVHIVSIISRRHFKSEQSK